MEIEIGPYTLHRNGNVIYRGFPIGTLRHRELTHVAEAFLSPDLTDDQARSTAELIIEARYGRQIEELDAFGVEILRQARQS